MTPQEALRLLKELLITKPGLSLDQCAAAVVAWNTIAAVLAPPAPPAPPEKEQ